MKSPNINKDLALALKQQEKYSKDRYNTTLEDYYVTPELKVNKYQLTVVSEIFPELTTFEHIALLKTNLHNMDKYGVALSLPKTYKIIKTINELKVKYPQICYNSNLIHPDYLRTAIQLITVLHNIHKITSNQLFTTNLNGKYNVLARNSNEPSGISIVNMEERHYVQAADLAFTLATRHKKPLTESNYLALIINLLSKNNLDNICNVATTFPLEKISRVLELPQPYVTALTK